MRTSMSFEKENCSLCFHRSSSNVYVLWSQPTFHSSLTTKLPFHKQDLQGIWSFWPFASNDHQPSLEWKGYRFSLWFNTLILTTGKSYFKKKKKCVGSMFDYKKKQEAWASSKIQPMLDRPASVTNHFLSPHLRSIPDTFFDHEFTRLSFEGDQLLSECGKRGRSPSRPPAVAKDNRAEKNALLLLASVFPVNV